MSGDETSLHWEEQPESLNQTIALVFKRLTNPYNRNTVLNNSIAKEAMKAKSNLSVVLVNYEIKIFYNWKNTLQFTKVEQRRHLDSTVGPGKVSTLKFHSNVLVLNLKYFWKRFNN